MTQASALREQFKRYPRIVLVTMLAQLSTDPGGGHIPAALDELNTVYRDLRSGRVDTAGAGCPGDNAPECGVGKEAH